MEAVEEYDTICSTDVYLVNGEQITESGRYVIPSVYGCDSIVKNVLVNESLILGVDSVISVCATDDNIIIPYVEQSGKLLEFAIKFQDEVMADASVEAVKPENGAMVVPMLKGIEPNRYKATLSFGELACGGEDIDVSIDVYYPDSVIAQRWNDVLAVRNNEYNGGYDFVAYQWYKNNELIDGATSSILYQDLDFDAKFESKGENEIEFTFGKCPFLGIWAKPGAPYVCIEPWYGVNDGREVKKDISEKRGIQHLNEGETFEFSWTAEIK